MDDIYCPYCGVGLEIDHDDGYGYEEDTLYQQTCSKCDKTFIYTASRSYYYDAIEAPCLNGGEHKWKPVIGAPIHYFVGQYHCEYCDDKKKEDSTEEEWRKITNVYLNR